MTSLIQRAVALLIVPVMLQAGAAPLSLRLGEASLVARPVPFANPAPDPAPSANSGAGQARWSGSDDQLARGIAAAYQKAHAAPAEEVTSKLDGTDRVYRIRTSMGVNMCLNWRDVDRFDPSKGKALFVLACNR